jgi:beta-glucosidase
MPNFLDWTFFRALLPLGFQGVVVSDYFALTDLVTLHHVAADNEAAARMALDAGVDMELPFAAAYLTLPEQVREGKVAEAQIDRAVSHVLRAKFLAGLFDDPYVDPAFAEGSSIARNTSNSL